MILFASLVLAMTALQWFITTPLMAAGVFALVWVSSRVYVRPWVFMCGLVVWFAFCTLLLWLTGYFRQP